MKIINNKINEYCTVNGCSIAVPKGLNYITINMNGRVEGWNKLPSLYDGYWVSTNENSILIAFVEKEPEDEWTKPFDVNRKDWYSSSYY